MDGKILYSRLGLTVLRDPFCKKCNIASSYYNDQTGALHIFTGNQMPSVSRMATLANYSDTIQVIVDMINMCMDCTCKCSIKYHGTRNNGMVVELRKITENGISYVTHHIREQDFIAAVARSYYSKRYQVIVNMRSSVGAKKEFVLQFYWGGNKVSPMQ